MTYDKTSTQSQFFFSKTVRIQENMDQKKLCIWTLFTQCELVIMKVPSCLLKTIFIQLYTCAFNCCFCKILCLCVPFKHYAFSIYFRDTGCKIIEVLHFFLNFILKSSGPNLINQGIVSYWPKRVLSWKIVHQKSH